MSNENVTDEEINQLTLKAVKSVLESYLRQPTPLKETEDRRPEFLNSAVVKRAIAANASQTADA